MKTSHYTSIIWMLYGFVFISAITAMLEAAVYAYMHYGLENGYMIRRFSYYIPCFACILYGITALIMVFISNRMIKQNKSLKLPKISFIVCMIIAISFQLLTESVSDWHLGVLFDDLSKAEYMSSVNFGKLFDVVNYTTFTLHWVSFIAALVFFSYKYKTIKNS